MAEAYGRGVVLLPFEGAAGGSPPPPPPPPPPPATRLDWMFFVSRNKVRGYEGFAGSAGPPPPPPPPPGAATVTIRLVDAAVNGQPLANLSAIQWSWWDDAVDEASTRGVPPTASGNVQITDEAGAMQLAANSTKSSGQPVFIDLYQHGYPPRAFKGLLVID